MTFFYHQLSNKHFPFDSISVIFVFYDMKMRLTFTVKYHGMFNLCTLFIRNNSQFSGIVIFTTHYMHLYKSKSHLKTTFDSYSEDA